MKQAILTQQGKESGQQATLSKDIFSIEPNEHVVYLDVKRIQAHKRQGTKKTKNKGEVTASTRKILRQKGSGNARKGSRKAGQLRGGSTFGVQPQNHTLKINKKVKILARKSVLSQKAKEKNIIILENIKLENAKTKNYNQLLQNLKLTTQKTLLILPEEDHTIVNAAKNLTKAKVTTAQKINSYDLLNANKLLLTQKGLTALHQHFNA